MKSFYTTTTGTFYTLDSDKVEVRKYHHIFWGLFCFTTCTTHNNKLS